ncbi:MAG TPA: PQQ-dependent sugar dehydrogenase [Steroidobacteraceae bacterium]|nr:PQQ-dependent sugar dehydrogenase [Steroidobacteraceae bacterium]
MRLLGIQALCGAGLTLLTAALLHSSLRTLPDPTLIQAALFGLGYLACTGVMVWRERAGRPPCLKTTLKLLTLAYLPALLFLIFADVDIPRRVVAIQLVLAGALALTTWLLRRAPTARFAVLGVAALATLAIPLRMHGPPEESADVRTWKINTELYPLNVTEYPILHRRPRATGGAVALLRNRYVVGTGDGDLYVVELNNGGHAFKATLLPQRAPMNPDDFSKAVGDRVDASTFRLADVLAQEVDGKLRLFVTHHYWKTAEKCSVLRVSMLESAVDPFLSGEPARNGWRTIFESAPCIPIDYPGHLPHFGGIQIGGRLALVSPHELMVAVGDDELDGVNSPIAAPENPSDSYGKTFIIDLHDFSNHVFSVGHRNPQGLFADGSGLIWLTEHGPQGGDELNLIRRGVDYGWPRVSYGVQYGTHAWPPDTVPGSHDGFEQPYYTWVPSIGVSSVVVIHGPLFKLWGGDVIVSSLKDGSLYRERYRDSRIVMTERMFLGRRIRDITEATDGKLVLWTDNGVLATLDIDTAVGAGEAAFSACSGCHGIQDGEGHGIGPDLRHIVNKPVASSRDFPYSQAMRNAGGKWTVDRLDAFLRNPQQFVPGTTMSFGGLPDAVDRSHVIEYLASGVNNHPPPEEPLPQNPATD